MPAFKALDFYAIDDQFSEEERMVRDTVRSWVSERFMPLIMDHFEAGSFPMELVAEQGDLGVFGSNLPEGYGCAGLSNVAYGLICQELERGDSGLRSFVSVQGSLVMWPIHEYGSEEQKRAWLPQLASGKVIGCFGLTEPDYGSNPGGMTTSAVRDGDDWLITGRKMWITNGGLSQIAIIWAKCEGTRIGGSKGFLHHEASLRPRS